MVEPSNKYHTYIGETARTLRQRASEHFQKARMWEKKSFIIRHWMMEHGLDTEPPPFKFEIMKKFNEPLGRQITEAILISKTGTLNLKNEFGNNHLCRLVSAKSNWEEVKEKKKEVAAEIRMEEDLRQFIKIMYNVSKTSSKAQDRTNQPSISRFLTQRKRPSTLDTDCGREGVIREKRRRMSSHSTPSNNHRGGDREMLNDNDLISPIQPVGNLETNGSTTGTSEHPSSSDGSIPALRARTEVSDPLCRMTLGPRNRRHDSSTEYAIEFLCLENAFRGRELFEADREKHLEWLDLEGLSKKLLLGVRLEDWSTLSLHRQEENNQGIDQERALNQQPEEEGCNKTPVDGENTQEIHQGKDDGEKEVLKRTLNLGAIKKSKPTETVSAQTPGATGDPGTPLRPLDRENQTPKRRLSPTISTPVGKSRKRSTTEFNSPQLRERLIMASIKNVNQAEGAPDLIQGIGRLVLRPTPQTPEAPRRIMRAQRSRNRTESERSSNNFNQTPRHQRSRTVSRGRMIATPPTQRLITEIFKQQNDGVRKDEDMNKSPSA